MFSNDIDPALEVRSLVRTGAYSRNAGPRTDGSGLAILLRPERATVTRDRWRGTAGYPGGPDLGQGSGVIDHLKTWPITYALIAAGAIVGTVLQVLYA